MQQVIQDFASELNLTAEFARGKRSTDIMVVEVGGRLDRTLSLYTRITDEFPEYDLELFNSGSGDAFGRRAAITQKLSEQPRRKSERRARLKFSEEEV